MSARAFRALFWATLAAVLAAVWLIRSDTIPAATGGPLTGFAARIEDVAKIIVETPAYSLTLEKRGGEWGAADRGFYPARAGAVANLLTGVAAMRLMERKTKQRALYVDIGVEDRGPGAGSASLAFEYAGGASAGGFILGMRSAASSFDRAGAVFARRIGEAQSWLAQGAAGLPREFSEWFAEPPAIPATQVRRVTITQGGSVVFDARKSEAGLYIRADAPEPAANDTAVKRIAQALTGTGFDDVMPAAEMSGVTRAIRMELADGVIEAIIGSARGQTVVHFEGAAAGAAGEVIALSKGFAYRLHGHRMSGLTQSLADLTAATAP